MSFFAAKLSLNTQQRRIFFWEHLQRRKLPACLQTQKKVVKIVHKYGLV